ncbi:ABC transporter ATP-binding protein [Roseomonas sp. E05]|uniref:ABC transporter ATP-binding protein n=1 Tax=Roseomonas sp. E05 TaxID=3046310 RepID=UPI0024B9BDFD|nr:ABC transporter ATP-binding protein [Roseomonas sp. E05]MDJ0391578.1 ABC transporter ATP-binding protein [Roseomonas sp. E05]
MSQELLRVERLTIGPRQGGPAIVQDVSFSAAQGEIVALIGESGSGKTTVSLAALGHARRGLAFRAGSVHVDGVDMTRAGREDLRRMRGRIVSYVAQSAAAAFNPAFRLSAQVTEPARLHQSRPRPAALAAAVELYRRFDLPEPERIGERYVHEVSGGQLQRFMLTMAMIEQPRLIVFDEPTSALDPTTQVEVLAAIRAAMRGQRAAAIFVSHDLPVVAQLADRIVVMRRGRVVEQGPARTILETPSQDYTRSLLQALRQRGKDSSPRAAARFPPVLEAKNISVGFGRGDAAVLAVDRVSMAVHPGEIVAVVGESGSGKTTLAHSLVGLHAPLTGGILLDGVALPGRFQLRSRDERRRIQMVFQSADTALNPSHTIGQILGRVLKLYFNMDRQARAARVRELLGLVHLRPEHAQSKPGQLSGGEKQRVNLARALAASPDVLICDEVTSALDTVIADGVMRLIATLCRERRLGIVMICHDLTAVAGLADEVKVMRRGVVVEEGRPDDVFCAPRHPYTRMLISSIPQLRAGWLDEALAARHGLEASKISSLELMDTSE